MLDFLQSFRGRPAAPGGAIGDSGDPTRTFDAILRAAGVEGAKSAPLDFTI